MKRLLPLLALVGCSDPIAPQRSHSAVEPETHLFLVGGQSNARYQEGFVSWETLLAQRGTDSAWPEFAARYYSLTGHKVAIVNTFNAGSSQVFEAAPGGKVTGRSWDERGFLFDRAVAMLDSALLNHPDYAFKGVLWVQGGADAKAIDARTVTPRQYRTSLVRMIARYRGRYGPVTPFYIFKAGKPLSGDTYGFEAVRAAQSRVATNDPLTFIAYAKAVTFPERGLMIDDLHYTTEAYVEMGRGGAVVASQAQ